MTKILKLFLIVLILGISCAQEDDDNGWPGHRRHGDEDRIINDPDTGPIMISHLPLIKVSSADMGYPNSMDAYLTYVDREISERQQQRYRQQHLPPQRARMRSILRPDGWIETKPGEAIDVPLQTASPNIPPDVIEYFEKSRKNDLALAEAVEKAENEKIKKETEKLKNELYWQKNKGVEKPIPQKQNHPHNGGNRHGKQHNDHNDQVHH